MATVPCGQCGADYAPRRQSQKWCSVRCGQRAHYLRNRERQLASDRARKARLKTPCAKCGKPRQPANKTGMCRSCAANSQKGIPRKRARRLNQNGYAVLTGYPSHPNAFKNGSLLEHVYVMSEVLGRPLAPGENVHHINGVRDDNRVENLELWVTLQPKGQRPEDLVAWAREVLARYDTT